MNYVDDALKDIRAQIAAPDDVLQEARDRRDLVRELAGQFRGTLRTFQSGSLAHGTVNMPVSDADCAVVLDRRIHSSLGPDSDENEPPRQVMDELRDFLRDKIRARYPDATFRITKRAIKIFFHAPLECGCDPTADLVAALSRAEDEALWIPNNDTNGWDASHPEKHVALLKLPNENVARLRRRIVRLAKAWNKQYSEPALSSFNITALALACINDVMSERDGLQHFFEFSAAEIRRHRTPDPTGVSDPIRLLIDKDRVVSRLEQARDLMREALDADTESCAHDSLQELFPDYQIPAASVKEAIAELLRKTSGPPAVLVPQIAPRPMKSVRSHRSQPRFRVGGGRRARKWVNDAALINLFVYGLRRAYPSLTHKVESSARASIFVAAGAVGIPGYPERQIRIEVSGIDRNVVRVFADGPRDSPHRNADDSLCIWWQHDADERRWTWEDGLVALVDLARTHLFKEAWWREHDGEWLGPQAPHV